MSMKIKIDSVIEGCVGAVPKSCEILLLENIPTSPQFPSLGLYVSPEMHVTSFCIRRLRFDIH